MRHPQLSCMLANGRNGWLSPRRRRSAAPPVVLLSPHFRSSFSRNGKGTGPILGGHADRGQGLAEKLRSETSAAFQMRLKDKHPGPLQFIVARRRCRTLVRSRAEALLRDSSTGSSHNPNAHATVSLVQFPNSMPPTSSSSTDSARATIVVPSRLTLV